MNILIYSIKSPYGTLPVGGAETSLRLIAEQMAALGYHVVFVANSREKTSFGYTKKNIKGVEVYTYTRFRFTLLNRYTVKKLTKKIKNWHFKKNITTNHIDIVHTYYNVEACLKFLALRENIPFKLVIRVAGMRPFEHAERKPRFRKGYQHLFRDADLLNFISKGLYQMYQNRGSELALEIPSEKCFIKDIGVDVQAVKAIPNVMERKIFVCTMASRFTRYQKRQDLLVEAVALLPKNLSIKLQLIGSGPEVKNIRDKIEAYSLSNKIQVVEFMPQPQLWNALAESDLICHACDYEGLSKIIIESMGMGKAILVSDVEPLNSYIDDRYNGFLVENTPEAWANRIIEMSKNPEDLHDVGRIARKFIQDNYDSKKNIVAYEEAFLSLLKDNQVSNK